MEFPCFLLIFGLSYFIFCLSAFITHSASVEQIKYIFQHLLPDLRNKTVLDVGSRTGAVLYGVSVALSKLSVIVFGCCFFFQP